MSAPLLEVRDLTVHFPVASATGGRGLLTAVDRVTFDLHAGETFGLVGESGCGKTTLGRALLRLVPIAAGAIRFSGVDVRAAAGAELKTLRRRMQLLFQDPWGSLDPRQRVGAIVAEGIELHQLAHGDDVTRRVLRLLERVSLPVGIAQRWPHELSGGQRQRVGIARALAVEPQLLVCDEAVAALDVSVQAQVIDLLLELRERDGLAYLFISHDLALVGALSHRIAVMHLGELVELGPAADLLARPRHPFTQALLDSAAARRGARGGFPLRGEPPSPIEPPPGCHFHPRCARAVASCSQLPPAERSDGAGWSWRCIL